MSGWRIVVPLMAVRMGRAIVVAPPISLRISDQAGRYKKYEAGNFECFHDFGFNGLVDISRITQLPDRR
jgi:hypothetical protein